MKHQQILDKLAARGLVRVMDEELARWVKHRMSPPGRTHAEVEQDVIPPVLLRWRCLFDAEDVGPAAKDIARVALATLLHKYGFQDPGTTAQDPHPPHGADPRPGEGLWQLSDLMSLQEDVRRLFGGTA
ncbi:hypothetical protein [Streptomyces sp. Wh19]|uniref:hypothetical protein n=1 Tax=Streptomyces sp. Wh19 TaxID=3076629 RepID=UPI0029587252|nr:hypothetical protein [Streptomyces sp. Wh19]MDV9196505.1 hypothetical protein [Streptomyces sp. Wh19]